MATYSGTTTRKSFLKTIYSTVNPSYTEESKLNVGVWYKSSSYYYVYRGIRLIEPSDSANVPSDFTQISKITLKIEIDAISADRDISLIYGGLNDYGDTTKEVFDGIGQMTMAGSVAVTARQDTTATVEITDQSIINKMMRYGIGLRSSYETKPASSDTDAFVYVTIYYTLEYVNNSLPPVVTLANATGSTMCQSGYSIAWTYSQFSDSKQNGVECDVDNHGTWVQNFKFDSTQQAISGIRGTTMSAAKYPKISSPSEDVNVRLRAVSAAGYWSNYATMVLTLKFPVCVPESPSGGENKLGGEDIVLTWSVSAVDGLAIGSYPTKYDVDYSTNGGESWISLAKKATIERVSQKYSYTIPANTLPEGVIKFIVFCKLFGNQSDFFLLFFGDHGISREFVADCYSFFKL